MAGKGIVAGVPALIDPHVRVHRSYVAAAEEMRAEGRGPGDGSRMGEEIGRYHPHWDDPAAFAGFVRALLAERAGARERVTGVVAATTLWWTDGGEWLGRLAIRHRLTPFLLDVGGHVGYDVRPSARRRGHATAMLRAALPRIADMGIDPVLITCDDDNVGSRKVIEACGGVLEDVRPFPGAPRRPPKRRYWVPTA